MNTQLFKYALEIDRTRSITQAAENLYMGQPNLSRAIKELEETLGFEIFVRTPKGVAPTEKGNEFLMYAKNIILQLENMERLSDMENKNLQSLSVSVPRASYISAALTEFIDCLDEGAPIDINYKETNAMQSISDVNDGKHSFAIIRYRLHNESYFRDYLAEKNLLSETIWEFERIILTSSANRYITNGIIKDCDLERCVQLVHGDTLVPYHKQYANRSGSDKMRKIRLYERANQFELLTSMPDSYMWTAPVPQSFLDKYSLSMVRADRPGKIYRDVLIYPKDYKFSALDKLFIEKVYEIKQNLIDNK